ncbi:MAG TPA: M48 family metallopeptidase [Bacteroidota bacterium]|nr:M48 family metallopeptidase [Bacteroidota bacterium]
MNIYGIIILLTLLVSYFLGLISDYLNIKNLKTELPAEFRDVYSQERYELSQRYLRENTRFENISGTFMLIITLVFWFAGGFEWVNQIAIKLSGNFYIRALIFIGILSVLSGILSLPFSIYETFVIEEKYGFNKTTPKIFITDLLKSTALSILLGVPLLLLVLYVFKEVGSIAWLYAWIAFIIISLIIQYIYPTLIMPIFNKFTPLEDAELKEKIMNYARQVNFPIKNVYVMDASKRSSKSNAFFTGFGKNKRIVLFDTLIANHTPDEILTILAHEVGHYKKHHIIQGAIISYAESGIMLYLLSLFIDTKGLYDAFYMTEQPIYAGILFFGMLFSAIELILSIFFNMLSRKNEREADKFAIQTTKMTEAFVSGLKKLSEKNLSNLTPHPFYVFLHYSHPPTLERIEYVKSIGI